MTTDNTDITADLDQDQSQLDAAQGGSQESQAAPGVGETNEIQALRQLADQVTELRKDVKDSQSKFDKGLNSFRARQDEAEKRAREQSMQQYQSQVDRLVETLPEDYREQVQYLANRNKELEEFRMQVETQNPQQSAEVPEDAAAQSQWEEIYSIPRDMGIDPESPGIDYAAFTDPGLNPTDRRTRFFKSLKTIMGNGTQPEPAPDSTPEVQSPPTGGTPTGGGSNNLRTERQISDAYLNDTITYSDYKKRLAETGRRI